LQKGKQTWIQAAQNTAAFTRTYEGHVAIVALNKGEGETSLELMRLQNGRYRDAISGEIIEVKGGAVRVKIPGHGLRVFVADKVEWDREPPTVRLEGLAPEAVVSGTIRIEAEAQDNNGISRVDLLVDGKTVDTFTEQSEGHFSVAWLSSSVANGPHTLRAVATDYSGNQSADERPFSTRNIAMVRRIHYFRPDWDEADIHFQNGSGWTRPPGVLMTRLGPGRFVFDVTSPLGTTEIQACFHKHGAGNEWFHWDSRGGRNYSVKGAEVWVKDGTVLSEQPGSLSSRSF
jgi:hypothetical protein